jgi:hypothetical protein
MNESEFIQTVLRNRVNRMILTRVSALNLRDTWLVSGCLFQTVWNVRTGRPPEDGIRDYDLFYFDASDVSWEAEDRAIRHAAYLFADLVETIELRNQARAHLWHPAIFNVVYPALSRATDAINRFLLFAAQVGIRPQTSGLEVYAPHGFDDIAAMILRPNTVMQNFRADLYEMKARRWKACWPELTVIPPAQACEAPASWAKVWCCEDIE